MVDDLPSASASLQGVILGGGACLAYRVGRPLHQAESALIYEATDEFGASLVLKLYHPQACQGEDPAVQWQREQLLLRRVSHPHVLRLRDAVLIDGQPALILERADVSLEAWILRHGPQADAVVRELARQLLSGLHAIHSAGVIHLDLSPMNVLLRLHDVSAAVPHCWIGDFGIGVLVEEGVMLSRPAGDWALLPPELLQPGRHQPTPRCDLYMLGLTLLFVLRGSLPLSNHLPLSVVASQVQGGLPHQEALRLGTPLARFLAHLLQVDPLQRPGSALEAWRLVQALD